VYISKVYFWERQQKLIQQVEIQFSDLDTIVSCGLTFGHVVLVNDNYSQIADLTESPKKIDTVRSEVINMQQSHNVITLPMMQTLA